MPGAKPLDRLLLARRLAAGLSEEAVAAAAGRPVAAIRALRDEPDFAELVASWRDLLRRPPAARDARLLDLAYAVLEDGLARGDMAVAAFVLREELRRRRAAATLAASLGRLIAQDLARARAAAAAEAAPGTDESPEPAAPGPAAGGAADPADRLVWRALAGLRRRMIEEHRLSWRAAPPPAAEPAPTAPDPAPEPAAGPAPGSPDTAPPPAPARRALPRLLGPEKAAPPALRETLPAAELLGRILAATPAPPQGFAQNLAAALVRLPPARLDLLQGCPPAAVARLLTAPPSPAMPEGP
jgi:hypothetical protein